MARLTSHSQTRLGRRIGLAGLAALAAGGVLTATVALGSPAARRPAARAVAKVSSAGQASPTVASGDAPAGFWYGTDSSYIPVPGGHPFREPVTGGTYGGYIGMIGNWATWQRCGGKIVWSKNNAAAARTDLETYHSGIGTGAYWFMAGPGVDPHYNGSYGEAYAWGEAQGKAALAAITSQTPRINYQVVFEDVELPGNAPTYTPAQDNGWTSVYTSPCSGRVRSHSMSAHVNRGDLNGFAAYLTAHSRYKVGVYSAPSIWGHIFGTGSDSRIPNTYEWTYTANTRSLTDPPYGWHLAGSTVSAQFFGGQTASSKYALMWQWSGGGGSYNGVGDFDQIDVSRTP